jgi:hypothetical protein
MRRWLMGAFGVGALGAVAGWGCTVDPGPNFVIPFSVFNADYFYCHVEPEYLFAPQTQCGAGQSTDNSNCHFNSSVVSGMVLQNHPLIDCGGGDHPANNAAGTGSIGPGSFANNNFSSASLEMSRNCTDVANCQAPILIRPSCPPPGGCVAHPRQIFTPAVPPSPPDALSNVILTWASTP